MNWDENKHPRDKAGKFTDKPYNSQDDFGYTVKRVKAATDRVWRQNTSYAEIMEDASAAELKEQLQQELPQLSVQERGVLRAEVMRKNAAQSGKVKPVNFAFTANYFYVYKTKGYDNFTALLQLDIEEEPEMIEFYIKLLEGKK